MQKWHPTSKQDVAPAIGTWTPSASCRLRRRRIRVYSCAPRIQCFALSTLMATACPVVEAAATKTLPFAPFPKVLPEKT